MTDNTETCCEKFDPQPWDEKEITWENKKFVKTRVRSLFHMPLNFASVMRKSVGRIEAADAKHEEMIVLSDEDSPWHSDLYIDVTKDVPEARMATLSGRFLSKVFEGPFKNIRTWVTEMQEYVKSQGRELQKLYFYYTTCPKCAKKYGKNYVVLLAQV
jgi:hypothetical protein